MKFWPNSGISRPSGWLPHRCYYVGLMATHGQGIPTDYGAARYWFQRAVAANDPQFHDDALAALASLEASIQEASDYEDALFDDLDRQNAVPDDVKWLDD